MFDSKTIILLNFWGDFWGDFWGEFWGIFGGFLGDFWGIFAWHLRQFSRNGRSGYHGNTGSINHEVLLRAKAVSAAQFAGILPVARAIFIQLILRMGKGAVGPAGASAAEQVAAQTRLVFDSVRSVNEFRLSSGRPAVTSVRRHEVDETPHPHPRRFQRRLAFGPGRCGCIRTGIQCCQ